MKYRLAAAGTHLLLSGLVVSLALSVIYFIWYPNPFYTIYSVFDAVKIVLPVDLILGPFLTLLVFNTLKSRKVLIIDISIIVLIQVSALAWGLHITYKVRPVFFVFQADTFYPVIERDINLQNLDKSISPPAIWESPKTVYIEPLKSEEAIQRMNKVARGKPIKGEMYQAEKYKSLSLHEDSDYRRYIITQAMSNEYLVRSNTWKGGVEQLVSSQEGNIEDFLFYPVENDRLFRGLIAFNKKDFSFSGLVSEP